MIKLYFLKATRTMEDGTVRGGYVGDQTNPSISKFKLYFLGEGDGSIHDPDSGLVLFFSKAHAQTVCQQLRDAADQAHPGHSATLEVVSDTFGQDIVDNLMQKSYRFTCEVNQ